MIASTRFSIAVHTLVAMEFYKNSEKTTSEFLAQSVGVNPVVVRRILSLLKEANLVQSSQGVAGFKLSRSSEAITLADVFEAVEEKKLFTFHENANANCPVGARIQEVLSPYMASAETSFLDDLSGTTIADLLREIRSEQLSI